MYELFPDVKVGDRLTADHVNRINEVCRALTRGHPGSFSFGQGNSRSSYPPFEQRRAIVVAEDYELGVAKGISGIYEIRFRFYNSTESVDEESSAVDSSSSSSSSSQSSLSSGSQADEPPPGWATDYDDVTHFLDMREMDETLAEGDKLTVYYDQQRGMYLPASAPGGRALSLAVAVDSILKGANGRIVIFGDPIGGSSLLPVEDGPIGIWSSVGGSSSSVIWDSINTLPTTTGSNATDSQYAKTTTANDTLWVKLGNPDSGMIQAVMAHIILRSMRIDDLRIRSVRVYKSDRTTPLTTEVRIYQTVTWNTLLLNATLMPSPVAPFATLNTPADWQGAFLKIVTDSVLPGTGEVRVAAAAVQLAHTDPDSDMPVAVNRLADIPIGSFVYVSRIENPVSGAGNPTYEIFGAEPLV